MNKASKEYIGNSWEMDISDGQIEKLTPEQMEERQGDYEEILKDHYNGIDLFGNKYEYKRN